MDPKLNVKAKVRERFMEKYPNTVEGLKENFECFVGFIVDETLAVMEENK